MCRQLVLARIIEPARKQDTLRVLGETGIDAPSYPTVNRGLLVYSRPETIVFAASRSAGGSKTELLAIVRVPPTGLPRLQDGRGGRDP